MFTAQGQPGGEGRGLRGALRPALPARTIRAARGPGEGSEKPASCPPVCFGRVKTGGEYGRPRGRGAGMHRVRGASGAVQAWRPGFPSYLSPRAPPSPPVSHPPETLHLGAGGGGGDVRWKEETPAPPWKPSARRSGARGFDERRPLAAKLTALSSSPREEIRQGDNQLNTTSTTPSPPS